MTTRNVVEFKMELRDVSPHHGHETVLELCSSEGFHRETGVTLHHAQIWQVFGAILRPYCSSAAANLIFITIEPSGLADTTSIGLRVDMHMHSTSRSKQAIQLGIFHCISNWPASGHHVYALERCLITRMERIY